MQKNKLIFGIHPIVEALSSGKDFDKMFIKRELRNEAVKSIIKTAKERGIPCQFVPEEKLNKLTNKNHQGIVAFLSQIEYVELEQLIPTIYEDARMPFFVILDGITDVRNFGAIARTCQCVGVDAIIIPCKGSVSVTGDAIKTSAGALMKIPVCRVSSIAESIKLLQNYGVKVFVASEKNNTVYTDVNYSEAVAIVMGAEDVGPSDDSLRLSDEIITIPQVGEIGSLNVSVASAVIMYEVFRQRNLTK